MTIEELLAQTYWWLAQRDKYILVGAVGMALLGTIATWVGKSGRTDHDGRVIASLLVGGGLVLIALLVVAIGIAHLAFGRSVLEANVLLLLAPIAYLSTSLMGVRLLFPVSQLGSVKTFRDVMLFAVACAAVLWVFSMFHGWGIIFFGGILQLVIILALTFLFLRSLWRRLLK